jgi:PhzF family phenazine biosynthesis protein
MSGRTAIRRVKIRHVDAFTSTPLEGNPAAVVDGARIDPDTMQRIARNQNLSETVFLLPAEDAANHARLRIFTPGTELPFAGHPTIAASHILVSEGLVQLTSGEPLRLETGAGPIPVEVGEGVYTMTQRPPTFAAAPVTTDEIAAWVGLAPGDVIRAGLVNTGIEWLIAQVASFAAFQRIRPNWTLLEGRQVSLFCIGAGDPSADIRVRTFAPGAGIKEDPVTGSSNGCIAALIARDRLLPARDGELQYVAEQGIEMGQPGRVQLRVSGIPDALSVQVGGAAVTVLEGELQLPG